MVKRLTELIKNSSQYICEQDSLIEEIANHILADGWIRLPCKVGDIVWNRDAEPYKVISIEWFSKKVTHLHCISPVTNIRSTFSVGKRSVGKTVFLTMEEAIAARKARKEKECD